jgi:hypothetical protein
MALPVNQLVGPQLLPNSAQAQASLSKFGETVTHEASGQYFNQALNGQSYIYTIASQALLLSATTGNVPTIWNPAGSGVIFVPTTLTITYISGTLVVGGVVIATTLNAGSAIGTAAPIVTFTQVTPKPAIRGTGFGSRCLFAPSTCTFTAAPVVEYATNINYNTTALVLANGTHNFNGTLAYYPGTAMSVCYTVTTSTALFCVSVTGIEVPVPPGS